MHTLTFRHTNTPSTFLQGEINGKVIPRLKSWNHATAVQYCPTSSDFPHTRWHVAGGEISSLAKKYIQSFFSITGSEEGGGGLQMTGFLPMNSWLVWRDATWGESEGGDSYFLILPDLPALTARIFGLGPLILFLLLLIQTLIPLPSSAFFFFLYFPPHAPLSLSLIWNECCSVVQTYRIILCYNMGIISISYSKFMLTNVISEVNENILPLVLPFRLHTLLMMAAGDCIRERETLLKT